MNIAELNKAEVLAALYNASQQLGMGFLNARGAEPMTTEQAQALLDAGQTYFDYLHGRVMKIDLAGDEVDTWGYDRDNGEGAAEKAIAHLRGVPKPEGKGFHLRDWEAAGLSTFSLEAEYTQYIRPLLDQLSAECERLGIPLVAIAAHTQDLQGVGYTSKLCIPQDIGRVPVGLLAAIHAAQCDFDALNEVLDANWNRMAALRTQQSEAEAATKH